MENIFLWPLFYVEVNTVKCKNYFLETILRRSKQSLRGQIYFFSQIVVLVSLTSIFLSYHIGGQLNLVAWLAVH